MFCPPGSSPILPPGESLSAVLLHTVLRYTQLTGCAVPHLQMGKLRPVDLIPERCSSKAYAFNRCAVMSPGDTLLLSAGEVVFSRLKL